MIHGYCRSQKNAAASEDDDSFFDLDAKIQGHSIATTHETKKKKKKPNKTFEVGTTLVCQLVTNYHKHHHVFMPTER